MNVLANLQKKLTTRSSYMALACMSFRALSADASDCCWEHGEFSLNEHYLVVLTFECRNANETLKMIFGAA